MMLMVALLLPVASTGAFAREFPAAENEDYPTVQALRYMGSLVEERTGGRHHVKVFHSRQPGEQQETIEQTRAGAVNNRPSFVTADHYKFAGHGTPTEHTMSPEVVVVSQKAWSSLSTDDQKIFHEALRSNHFMRDPAMAQLIERIREVE